MAWSTPQNFTTGQLVDEADMDAISDNFAALLPPDQVEWDTWTPSLTNITQGNGTVATAYTQVGKMVICQFLFTFGSSGSAMGTNPTISLPVTATTPLLASVQTVGRCHMVDGGATNYHGGTRLNSTTLLQAFEFNVDGSNNIVSGAIGSTSPFTWANTDTLYMDAVYEAA